MEKKTFFISTIIGAIALSILVPPALAQTSTRDLSCKAWVNRLDGHINKARNEKDRKVKRYTNVTERLRAFANKYLSDPNAGDEAQTLLSAVDTLQGMVSGTIEGQVDGLAEHYYNITTLMDKAKNKAIDCDKERPGARDEFKASLQEVKDAIAAGKQVAFGENGIKAYWQNTGRPAAYALRDAVKASQPQP